MNLFNNQTQDYNTDGLKNILTNIFNYNNEFHCPAIVHDKVLNERHKLSFVGPLVLLDVHRSKKINTYIMKLLTMGDAEQWWTYEIGVPKILAYALALTDFKRDTIMEKLLEQYIIKYPNPFYQQGQTTNPKEFGLNLYQKVAYHLIWCTYIERNDLKETLKYDKDIHQKILDFLNGPIGLLKPYRTNYFKDGFYYYEPKEEIGYSQHNGIPYGVGYLPRLTETLYYICLCGNFKRLIKYARLIFKRLKVVVNGTYLQLRGGGRFIINMNYLTNILSAFSFLYQMDKELHIGEEYYYQLSTIPEDHKRFLHFPNYPNIKVPNTRIFMHSLTEGFSLIKDHNFICEIAANSSLYATEAGYFQTDDELDAQYKDITRGYINYGYNYTYLIRNYMGTNADVKLPGQINDIHGTQYPSSATIFYVHNDLYYTSIYNDRYLVHGFLDTKIGVHKYTVKHYENDTITYYPFVATSKYTQSYTRIDDNTIAVYDTEKSFVISSSETKLYMQYVNLNVYGSCIIISTEIPSTLETTIKISKNNDNDLTNLPLITTSIPFDKYIFTPTSATNTPLTLLETKNNVYLIDTSIGIWPSTPKSVQYNGVNYGFNQKSLQSSAKIPKKI